MANEKKQIKIQKTLERSQIAAFLRMLATEIEDGSVASDGNEFGVDLHNFNKLKVRLVRQAGGQLHLKLNIKDGDSENDHSTVLEEFEDIADTRYKPLKKQMAATFKELARTLERNTVPSAQSVEMFLAQAEKMVSHPGFGDEHYDLFLKECRDFKRLCLAHDVAGASAQHVKITSLTKECHRRYK